MSAQPERLHSFKSGTDTVKMSAVRALPGAATLSQPQCQPLLESIKATNMFILSNGPSQEKAVNLPTKKPATNPKGKFVRPLNAAEKKAQLTKLVAAKATEAKLRCAHFESVRASKQFAASQVEKPADKYSVKVDFIDIALCAQREAAERGCDDPGFMPALSANAMAAAAAAASAEADAALQAKLLARSSKAAEFLKKSGRQPALPAPIDHSAKAPMPKSHTELPAKPAVVAPSKSEEEKNLDHPAKAPMTKSLTKLPDIPAVAAPTKSPVEEVPEEGTTVAPDGTIAAAETTGEPAPAVSEVIAQMASASELGATAPGGPEQEKCRLFNLSGLVADADSTGDLPQEEVSRAAEAVDELASGDELEISAVDKLTVGKDGWSSFDNDPDEEEVAVPVAAAPKVAQWVTVASKGPAAADHKPEANKPVKVRHTYEPCDAPAQEGPDAPAAVLSKSNPRMYTVKSGNKSFTHPYISVADEELIGPKAQIRFVWNVAQPGLAPNFVTLEGVVFRDGWLENDATFKSNPAKAHLRSLRVAVDEQSIPYDAYFHQKIIETMDKAGGKMVLKPRVCDLRSVVAPPPAKKSASLTWSEIRSARAAEPAQQKGRPGRPAPPAAPTAAPAPAAPAKVSAVAVKPSPAAAPAPVEVKPSPTAAPAPVLNSWANGAPTAAQPAPVAPGSAKSAVDALTKAFTAEIAMLKAQGVQAADIIKLARSKEAGANERAASSAAATLKMSVELQRMTALYQNELARSKQLEELLRSYVAKAAETERTVKFLEYEHASLNARFEALSLELSDHILAKDDKSRLNDSPNPDVTPTPASLPTSVTEDSAYEASETFEQYQTALSIGESAFDLAARKVFKILGEIDDLNDHYAAAVQPRPLEAEHPQAVDGVIADEAAQEGRPLTEELQRLTAAVSARVQLQSRLPAAEPGHLSSASSPAKLSRADKFAAAKSVLSRGSEQDRQTTVQSQGTTGSDQSDQADQASQGGKQRKASTRKAVRSSTLSYDDQV